ncbi:SDR family NAD(P)-dependent oxidoreductase [Actinomycetospora endophytica]|uniref:SDR family NAD(P)-dependent oxidoreductase n=1 Tax=Actinomycetospora endophytica TaxID=2291215 RepID=A0ABS8PGG6_9PSEU|nr:SDR family NAD(P)-dependent oxidoreductase [Actinomycetospora endophytica]MCD2197348.1 SDR family NAD(P)-dependent oxidoreductase [Actinomycetospora endophytica]
MNGVDSTITLVTGANKGLGRETARRLVKAGHTVLVSARSPSAGREAASDVGGTFVPLDVTSDASVAEAFALVRDRFGRLDVLVNNAGIVGPRCPLPEVTADDVLGVLDANVLGVVRVTRAFLPLLRASAHPRIVNVSSGTGRLTWQVERGWPQDVAPPIYSMSKAALTMLTLQYAQSLPGILVNAAWPGYTATGLNDHQGTQTVTEGTDPIVALATLPPGGPTGTMRGRKGAVDPW